MRRYLLRETTFTHFSVVFGVLLLSAALAMGPLGKASPLSAEPLPETEATAQTTPVALRPYAASEQLLRDDAPVSSRGGREVAHTQATSTPNALVVPAVPPPEVSNPGRTLAALTFGAPASASAPTPVPTDAMATPAAAATPRFHVGIQAGHWKESELPAELASLRTATGAAGPGWREVDVTVAVANKVAALLRNSGVAVDVLPATVPVAYKADAFLALHGDANGNTSVSGYKLARARWSQIPQKDDALIQAVSVEYRLATGLNEHPSSITEDMRQYYAFDWKQLQHAVAPTTPSAILEMGFLTTASDRALLLGQQDRVASGIAKGIMRFLTGK